MRKSPPQYIGGSANNFGGKREFSQIKIFYLRGLALD